MPHSHILYRLVGVADINSDNFISKVLGCTCARSQFTYNITGHFNTDYIFGRAKLKKREDRIVVTKN